MNKLRSSGEKVMNTSWSSNEQVIKLLNWHHVSTWTPNYTVKIFVLDSLLKRTIYIQPYMDCTVEKTEDFYPAIHECPWNNPLCWDFHPWIKICTRPHAHLSEPMIIHEWAHKNPWFWKLNVSKSRIIVGLFMDDHGLWWMSMPPYADFYPWIKIPQ